MTPASPGLPAVARLLEAGREEGVAPGLAAAVRAGGQLVHLSATGDAQVEPVRRPLGPADLFDVASLTKPLATATLAALLAAEGRLDLDEPVARQVPAFASGAPEVGPAAGGSEGRERVTVRQLLSHSSGLPAWRPFFELVAADPLGRLAFLPPAERPADLAAAFERGRELVRAAVLAAPLEAEPGTRALYSDLGFLLLGWVVEAAGGAGLDRLFAERVAAPLGLRDSFFGGAGGGPGASGGRRAGPGASAGAFVATEHCPHRGEVNLGAVNDDNAWAMGGVAGHAGLFSTAAEVAALGQAWLDALRPDGGPQAGHRPGGSRDGAGRRGRRRLLLDPDVAAEFARVQGAPGTTRALGWDTPSPGGSSLGTRLGRGRRGALGHLGFTGTSVWIDLDAGVVAALLTNRVHPSRDNDRIRAFRPRFHDVVAEAVAV